MADSKLLITGATGYIGFKVLLDALQSGYSVRVAIRSLPASEDILANPRIKALAIKNNLSFIEVADITQDHAYDEALKGITWVIHLAAPLPLPFIKNYITDLVQPTVNGVASLLNSALRASSVKRVVITSSIVANIGFPHVSATPTSSEIAAETRVHNLEGPFTDAFHAYCAAKIASLNATDKFKNDYNPSFDIINIMPGFVYGRDERASNPDGLLKGSNRLLLESLLGQNFDTPRLGAATHVDDVAKIHLLALNSNIPGGADYGVTIPVIYNDAFDIVQKVLPEAVGKGVFTRGHLPSLAINWNASKTENAFQYKLKRYQEMVSDLAGQYLELLKIKKA